MNCYFYKLYLYLHYSGLSDDIIMRIFVDDLTYIFPTYLLKPIDNFMMGDYINHYATNNTIFKLKK